MDTIKERIKNLEMILTPVKEKKGAILQTVWGLGKVAGELYLEIEGIYIPILNNYLQISGYIDTYICRIYTFCPYDFICRTKILD